MFGIPVNVRLMCGLQTKKRPAPINPKQYPKQVLYYDGRIYDGWQKPVERKETQMNTAEEAAVEAILKSVRDGRTSVDSALKTISRLVGENPSSRASTSNGSGCQY